MSCSSVAFSSVNTRSTRKRAYSLTHSRDSSFGSENSGNLGYIGCFSLEREGLAQARGSVFAPRISWDSRLGEGEGVDTGGSSLEREHQIKNFKMGGIFSLE
ncbi:hypothetical protein Lal_00000848 [Lupinus albus]|nr:hypothetical protein Lal_00000848 [Lupinus albus]